jgi:hypothetical protein
MRLTPSTPKGRAGLRGVPAARFFFARAGHSFQLAVTTIQFIEPSVLPIEAAMAQSKLADFVMEIAPWEPCDCSCAHPHVNIIVAGHWEVGEVNSFEVDGCCLTRVTRVFAKLSCSTAPNAA